MQYVKLKREAVPQAVALLVSQWNHGFDLLDWPSKIKIWVELISVILIYNVAVSRVRSTGQDLRGNDYAACASKRLMLRILLGKDDWNGLEPHPSIKLATDRTFCLKGKVAFCCIGRLSVRADLARRKGAVARVTLNVQLAMLHASGCILRERSF